MNPNDDSNGSVGLVGNPRTRRTYEFDWEVMELGEKIAGSKVIHQLFEDILRAFVHRDHDLEHLTPDDREYIAKTRQLCINLEVERERVRTYVNRVVKEGLGAEYVAENRLKGGNKRAVFRICHGLQREYPEIVPKSKLVMAILKESLEKYEAEVPPTTNPSDGDEVANSSVFRRQEQLIDDQKRRIENYKKIIAEHKRTIAGQKKKIADQKTKIADLNVKLLQNRELAGSTDFKGNS